MTWELRRSVLRPHETVDDLAAADRLDAGPGAAAFAAVTPDGEVVGTVRVAPGPSPVDLGDPVGTAGAWWRLRGMATRSDLRSQGIGSTVLDRALGHLGECGGGLVWCNARIPAVGLYRRHGFVVHGEAWEDPDLGPHVVMWRTVAPSGG